MDYVVGGVAALISGNVTPNRPRLIKKALTPVKHPTSPNVTPKSQLVDDKSMFLSPTLQKKKAIIKKSPKRIFENQDLNSIDDEMNISSPKADKVKKHLTNELDGENLNSTSKNKKQKQKHDIGDIETPKKRKKSNGHASTLNLPNAENTTIENPQNKITNATIESVHDDFENIPKKLKKNKKKNKVLDNESLEIAMIENTTYDVEEKSNANKKKKKKNKVIYSESQEITRIKNITNEVEGTIKGHKKKKKNKAIDTKIEKTALTQNTTNDVKNVAKTKKNKKNKKLFKSNIDTGKTEKITKNKELIVNPNAITHEDTDSEHESDNEIESDNKLESESEEVVNNVDDGLENSSDEEDSKTQTSKQKLVNNQENKKEHEPDAEEIKRTIFVGNVPFSKKCKKEIKKIFSKYGPIASIRIRAVPVKDAQTSRKMAVIKNELHPDRVTVNVYVKFREESSVNRALSENNTVLDGCHLRVSRSDTTGAHDTRRALFVGNLPFAIEDETLRAKFEKCGQIESVRVIRDKKTNIGKGFGYINFASKDGVELALSLPEEELMIKNRILRVKRCTTGDNSKQKITKKNNFQKKEFLKKNNNQVTEQAHGAFRRIMHKRKIQGPNTEGPPQKKHKDNIGEPNKNKKPRKEYLGITAEKKKKKNFNKNQKKKKVISELLSK